MSFLRMAGIAGIVLLAVGATGLFTDSTEPDPDASIEEIRAFLAEDTTSHQIRVIRNLSIFPVLALFFAGVVGLLHSSDRTHEEAWATATLIGVVGLIASGAAGEAILYGLFLSGGEGLDDAAIRGLWDAQYVALRSSGPATAVICGSVAIPVLRYRLWPRWYGWLSVVIALLGILGVVDTVTTSTGNFFSGIAYLTFGFIWILTTSILMVRRG